MVKLQKLLIISLVLGCSLLLAGCGKKNSAEFSNDSDTVDTITPYVDKFATQPISISTNHKLNEEFTVKYKTYNPNGEGVAMFKAKSIKEIPAAGKRTPEDGKKLYLVEIAIRGTRTNKGDPTTFNQVGDTPSPQFVMIDKSANKSFVETTYYSDGYTADKNLFELSKITLDSDQWVNTAIVFELDKNLTPNLAFRYVNLEGKTDFYAITQ